ncbi:MAG: diphthine synthase [Candidatus Aenigmatarchaeota archaeon]
MLYLIGIGFEEKDLTLKSLEIARKCDCYLELYTSYWKGSLENLKNIIGKNIKILKRKDLEENLSNLLKKAKKNDIAILIPGDPLVATTHIDLVIEARKKKIPVEIVHNASIFSAIGEIGLQIYKYGKSATIPFNEKLENVKKTIKNNKKMGLHTLLLLDLDAEVNLYMNVNHALRLLLRNKIISNKEKLIAANIGGEIYYDNAKNLFEKEISTPSVLIIPGRLHFREKEFLGLL